MQIQAVSHVSLLHAPELVFCGLFWDVPLYSFIEKVQLLEHTEHKCQANKHILVPTYSSIHYHVCLLLECIACSVFSTYAASVTAAVVHLH